MYRMAEGNGEVSIEEVPGKDSDANLTPDYRHLIEYGLDSKVNSVLNFWYIYEGSNTIYTRIGLAYLPNYKKVLFFA